MSSFNFNIQGAKELDNALKSLGIELETKIARSAVRAGAVVIKNRHQYQQDDAPGNHIL